jgi:DNA sulfur modification protein DndB
MTLGTISFIAIEGHQGSHKYYIIQCPMRLIPRIFLFGESEISTQLRQSRALNAAKTTEIVNHLISQPESYILPPLVATVDENITFEPLDEKFPEIGRIQIPLTARLIIHHGQHRSAAIQQVLSARAFLQSDTIAVMLVPDALLDRSERLFDGLNHVQIPRSRSERVLYESSDIAALVRRLIDDVPLFRQRVELEKTTISNRSTALFTLSGVYQATQSLLGLSKNADVETQHEKIAYDFWNELGKIIPEWRRLLQDETTSAYLRENYVHSHTVMLIAIGRAGKNLIADYPNDWRDRLSQLGSIDWSRTNAELWEGRAMVRGKMSKAHDSIALTTIAIKRALKLDLTEKEKEMENRLIRL